MRRLILSLALCAALGGVQAAETLETAEADGISVPYILTKVSDAPKYAVVLFPGGDGIVNPHLNPAGRPAYRKKTNFLARARKLLVDADTAAVFTDSSSDPKRFRVLAADLKNRFPGAKLFLISTSRGTESSMALAPEIDGLVEGIVHTSSVKDIVNFDTRKLKSPQLIIHHNTDECRRTPFWAAKKSSERFGTEFIAFTGGVTEGDVCQPFAYHGYNGIEKQVVDAIREWMARTR